MRKNKIVLKPGGRKKKAARPKLGFKARNFKKSANKRRITAQNHNNQNRNTNVNNSNDTGDDVEIFSHFNVPCADLMNAVQQSPSSSSIDVTSSPFISSAIEPNAALFSFNTAHSIPSISQQPSSDVNSSIDINSSPFIPPAIVPNAALLSSIAPPSLPSITSLNESNTSHLYDAPLRSFSRALCAEEPIYQLCPHPIVHHLLNIQSIADLHEQSIADDLRYYSPVLASLIFGSSVWDENNIRTLLQAIAIRSSNVLDQLMHLTEARPMSLLVPNDDIIKQYENFTKSGSLYAAKLKRIRPRYAKDKSKDIRDDFKKDECGKVFAKFNDKNGGLWMLRCAKHGVCLGFHVVPRCEGLNDPFSALYCHWTEAPKLMIGDFNCKLHTYAMYREPEFFKDTIFGIDECHCKGHTSCSKCYSMKSFKDGHPTFALMNDSAAEQRNRIINRLRLSAAWMNLETFMFMSRLMVEIDNRILIRNFLDLETI